MIRKHPGRKVVQEPEMRETVSVPNLKKAAAGTSKTVL